MRVAVTYGPMCLQRSAEETWNDPRTGSEVGWRRIVEELKLLGHQAFPLANSEMRDVPPHVVVSINEPDRLRDWPEALRICEFWLNEFSFCKEGFDEHTDLYLSPSEAHRKKAIGDWGAPKPEKWHVNHLGCDPPGRLADASHAPGEHVPVTGAGKVSGRVVYCSSPDRGLHRVLEAWPRIKLAAPHASLRIFYNLNTWLRSFDQTPYYPPIEKLRGRALWCEEALKRLSGPQWGITVVDSVSHDQLLQEMQQAEVLVHPCETTSWSEGFSVTVLEGCAAQACPIISDCDALGDVYRELDPVPVGNWQLWRERVVQALTDAQFRAELNAKAKAIAERLTWARHAKQLDEVIHGRIES